MCEKGFGDIAEVDHLAGPVEVASTKQLMGSVNLVRSVGLTHLGDQHRNGGVKNVLHREPYGIVAQERTARVTIVLLREGSS